MTLTQQERIAELQKRYADVHIAPPAPVFATLARRTKNEPDATTLLAGRKAGTRPVIIAASDAFELDVGDAITLTYEHPEGDELQPELALPRLLSFLEELGNDDDRRLAYVRLPATTPELFAKGIAALLHYAPSTTVYVFDSGSMAAAMDGANDVFTMLNKLQIEELITAYAIEIEGSGHIAPVDEAQPKGTLEELAEAEDPSDADVPDTTS